MFVYRRLRRRIGHDSLCVYLYFFRVSFISLTTFRTFEYTISNNSTLASPVQQKRKKTHTQYMQRDFTAVAFLRQISIITKLLFFSGSVEKHRQTDRQTELLWRVIFCIFCFFLPLSGSVVHL